MKSSDLSFYIGRKIGIRMPFRYKMAVLTPALLIVLISFILNFSIIFINSMSRGIENILIMLGSGDIAVEGDYDGVVDGEVYKVRASGGLAFSEDSNAPLYLKGVDYQSYFTSSRSTLLHLQLSDYSSLMNPVIISRFLSEELDLDISGRFTILLYEQEKGRSRPILATVAGIYDSGYMEFDRYLCYLPLSLLEGNTESEIVLNDHKALSSVLSLVRAEGYTASDYRTLYSSIYDNLILSIRVLYGVFIILAILASFFSGNISYCYLDRDRKDIALLFLSGLTVGNIRRVYIRITMIIVAAALLIGLLLSSLFSLITPFILSFLKESGFDALNAYLTSFQILFPLFPIALINAILLLFS